MVFELIRQLSLFKFKTAPISPLTSFGAQKSAMLNTSKTLGSIPGASRIDDLSLQYIFTPSLFPSSAHKKGGLILGFSKEEFRSISVSLHSMQIASIATFTRIKSLLESTFDLDLSSPGSSSPDIIEEAMIEPCPHFIVLPDSSIETKYQKFLENYNHCLVLWEEPHYLIGRELGRKRSLIVTGSDTTGDYLRIKKYKKYSNESVSVPVQKESLVQYKNEQIYLVLPGNKTRNIRGMTGVTIVDKNFPVMSFSLYSHKSIISHSLALNDFLRLYVSAFNTIRAEAARASIWQIITLVRDINRVPGLRNHFRMGKFSI